jgi:predicted Zn-dependent protease with MMP-like domain
MKRMSLAKFGRLVARVMETLPAEFKPFLENLVVDVEEEPDERTLVDQEFTPEEIAEGATLYGLFCPFPIAGETEFGGVAENDQPLHRIIVYKNPLEEDFPDPRELRREIRKTVVHELAHHFGYTERDLEPFESKEDPFGDEGEETPA